MRVLFLLSVLRLVAIVANSRRGGVIVFREGGGGIVVEGILGSGFVARIRISASLCDALGISCDGNFIVRYFLRFLEAVGN